MPTTKTGLRLPDFIAVGPPRTATTWLHEVLKERVCLPAARKETDFFNRFYERGLDWYADFFRHCAAGSIVGELSPMYFASELARERIAATIPECKIICSFRDPVERAYSNYRLLKRQAYTKADFETAVTTRGDLVESSRYGTNLEKWLAAFGRERVLVLIYDDLEADPQAFLDSVCDFIGIARFAVSASAIGADRVNLVDTQPPSPRMARMARNMVGFFATRRMDRAASIVRRNPIIRYMLEGGEPFPPPPPDAVARLRERYRPEIEKLEQLTGRDLSGWKTGRRQERKRARRPAAR